MVKDLRKLRIKRVRGRVFPKLMFFNIHGLNFVKKSDAISFQKKLMKGIIEKRKRMKK